MIERFFVAEIPVEEGLVVVVDGKRAVVDEQARADQQGRNAAEQQRHVHFLRQEADEHDDRRKGQYDAENGLTARKMDDLLAFFNFFLREKLPQKEIDQKADQKDKRAEDRNGPELHFATSPTGADRTYCTGTS